MLEPSLLLLNELLALVEVLAADRSCDAQRGKLLDDGQVNRELLVLLSSLLALFSLVLLLAADLDHVGSFAFGLRLRDKDFARGQLLIEALLDGFLLQRGLGLSRRHLVVDNDAQFDFGGVDVAEQVLATVDFLQVGVRHSTDRYFFLLLALLEQSLVL